MPETATKVALKRNRTGNRTFWERQVKQYQASGQSRTAYCREHGVNYDRFQYWYRKFNDRKEVNPIPVQLVTAITSEAPGEDCKATVLCTLKLGNGATLLIHELTVLNLLFERVG